MERTILTFEDVAKSYGEIRALRSLSLTVRRDEIVALLGPNGAGKTTALEIALGLRDADSGAVRLFGASPRSVAIRRRVGATPQESGFPDMLRVEEIVAFVAEHCPAPAPLRKRYRASDSTSWQNGALERSRAESRGVSRSRSHSSANPEFVVLDEPTTGLDVRVAAASLGGRARTRRRPVDSLHDALSRRSPSACDAHPRRRPRATAFRRRAAGIARSASAGAG